MTKRIKKLTILLAIVLVFSLSGCIANIIPPEEAPNSLPKDYIEIPDYVTSPYTIELWLMEAGAQWVQDRITTGYTEYVFTPAEFILEEVPDEFNLERTIKKRPFQGDCYSFAIFNAYVAYAALDYDCYIAIIKHPEGGFAAHALAYGYEEPGGNCHVWSNQYYKGEWESIETFVEEKYPGWVIYQQLPLEEKLNMLFERGHLEYAPRDNYE